MTHPSRVLAAARNRILTLLLGGLLPVVAAYAQAPAPAGNASAAASIVLASTTSTEQSGLFAYLLPLVLKATGIQVRVVAVGTGQALDIARRGDADAVLVHDRAAEDKAVADGALIERQDVMYNDFVLIGPKADPAAVRGQKDIVKALAAIASREASFVSRGDKSGTHAAELRLWKLAGLDPVKAGGPGTDRRWYAETGSGMGPSLNIASARNAYLLADRGTWLSFRNRGDLALLLEGDARLFNPYGVALVNPARHPHVKADAARRVAQWLVSREGQAAIASYRIEGESLFFPGASAR